MGRGILCAVYSQTAGLLTLVYVGASCLKGFKRAQKCMGHWGGRKVTCLAFMFMSLYLRRFTGRSRNTEGDISCSRCADALRKAGGIIRRPF